MRLRFPDLWMVAVFGVGLAQNLWAFQDLPVQFTAGTVQLAGTLTLPNTPGPHPALVLIAGGWPSDRDDSHCGGRYKIFKIIADDLAAHGFATLRYDSPGRGGSTGGMWGQRTLNDRADEVANAIQFLKQDTRINARRIGLLGHSEGSDVAVLVASKSQDAAFLVLLSPHAKPVREAFSALRAGQFKEMGVSESKEVRANWDDFYARTVWPAVEKGQTNWQGIIEQAEAIARKAYDKLPRPEQSKFKDFDSYFQSSVDNGYLVSVPTAIPHLQSVVGYNPLKSYGQIRCPVLLVGGEADSFAADDLPALTDAVRQSGNTNCITKIMPGAGHILNNPAVSREHPVPELLPTICGWLERVASPTQ
jgi:pimeloyl-ACP methyl ester carboxylesterase